MYMWKIKHLFIGIIAFMAITSCNDQNMIQNTPPLSHNQDLDLPATQQEMHRDDETDIIKGEYIIKFENQFEGRISESVALQADQLRNQILTSFNIHSDSVLSEYNYAFKGFAAKLSKEKVEALKKDPRIARVTPNALFKLAVTDFISKSSEHANATFMGQTTPWGITRVGGPLDGTGTTAWILDTGIDLDHPDLDVDVPNSVSFIAAESADDVVGHGTHVAGIIAAENNSIDVVGVAAGATVVAVKVCNSLPPQDPESGCPTNDIIDGVDYVASHAQSGDIVNMSLGRYDPNNDHPDVDNAVTNAANAGIRFTIAAGNAAWDASDFTPARVNHSNVWTVSAFRQGDKFVQVFDWNTPNCNPSQSQNVGSNYNNPPIDFAAPGENIKSLWKNGGTKTTCGTSMAAPHIAGLLLAAPNDIHSDGAVNNDPDANPDEIAVYAPFTVSISGPTFRESGEQGTWTANPQNGSGSYTYQWYYQNPGSTSWQTGGTSSSYSHTFTNSGTTAESAGIRVEVTSAGEQAEYVIGVVINGEGCPSGQICP